MYRSGVRTFHHRRAPPAVAGMRVGRTSEPAVVALGPVELVVAALGTGSGPVRDLVPLQPGGGQQLVGELVLLGLVVGVGVAGRIACQRRPGFDGQGVGADVRRAGFERQGRRDGRRPSRRWLSPAAPKIRSTLYDRRIRPPRRPRPPGHGGDLVLTPKGAQHVGHHRLHTKGQAGDSSLAIAAELAGVDRLRVALDRHLCARQTGIAPRMVASRPAARSEGVPPPKKTDEAAGIPAATALSTSVRQAAT